MSPLTRPGPHQPPLRIAFVVDRFGARYGGAEAYGLALMQELSAAGHQITVFAREYDTDCGLQLPYVPIRVGRHWPSWIRVLLFAWRAARATRTGFDLVHSHMNGWCGDIEVVHVTPVRYRWRVQAMSFTRRALSRVSPRVQTYLGLEARRVAARPGHRVVAVSALIAHQLTQAYGDCNVPIIPPGVSLPGSARPDQGPAIRSELGLTAEHFVCLLVARNPMRKGLPTVLQALERLPAQAHLLVVGVNAASREHIRHAPASVRDRVHLVGETSDVSPYYQAANCYVHPTLNDSFGMAPLEAMSFGLPVVLSPVPWCGFAQYVQPGVDALVLSHPERPDELAQAIERLRTEPSLRQTLASGSRQLLAHHAWPEVAQQYLALYAQILSERPNQTQPRTQ